MSNKFALISLGCPKNLVDSDNLTEKLTNSGLSYIDNHENADILLINTCGFIQDAKRVYSRDTETRRDKKGQKKMQDSGCRIQDKKIVYRASCIMNQKTIIRNSLSFLKAIPEQMRYSSRREDRIVKYCKNKKVRVSPRILVPSNPISHCLFVLYLSQNCGRLQQEMPYRYPLNQRNTRSPSRQIRNS